LSKGGLRDGIDGTCGDGAYDGVGVGAGLEKPERESLGLAPPVADFGRGLSASDGSEFEGICQPPSLAWSTCIPAVISSAQYITRRGETYEHYQREY